MRTIYLNLSIAIQTEEPLEVAQDGVVADLEYHLEEQWKAKVLHCTWDRLAALEQTNRELTAAKTVLDHQRDQALEESQQVAAVLQRLNITLPKTKYGHAEWRVPTGPCYGESRGLSNFRGELVLTDGVSGIMVLGFASDRAKWVQIHFDNFVPDKAETLPKGLTPNPRVPKEQVDAKLLAALEHF